MSNNQQVLDEPLLLERMMSDLERSDALYRPTNYWEHYAKVFLPELKNRGLKDFRRRKYSILGSFGATDLLIKADIRRLYSFRGAGRITALIQRLINSLPFLKLEVDGIVPEQVAVYFYWLVKGKFNQVGLDLRQCPTNRFGNPEDLQEIEGGLWSLAHLQYCSMLADAARTITYRSNSVICELGAGMGRNIEAAAHLFKDATLLLFDIPPQLYVAHQYLKSVFGDRVVSYEDAVSLVPTEGALGKARGKIVVLPSWRMPAWSSTKIDVFWNSGSFQEMEPDVVKNYLRLAVSMRPEWIYVNALPQGNYWGEWKPGRGGTKEAVLARYYEEAVSDTYSLDVTYPTDYFLRQKDHTSYLFRRR